jgi:hypothetical protein
MLATRPRFGLGAEWLTACVFLVATVVVAVLVVRALRITPPTLARTAHPAVTASSIPPRAVSVPTLVLGVQEIRVGDSLSQATDRLAAAKVVMLKSTEDVGVLGHREARSYQLGATRFIVVMEPFERGGTPRVAAIYLE